MKRIPGLLSALAMLCLAATSTTLAQATDQVSLIQITNALGAGGAPVRGVSDDGKRIVFESAENLTGDNADFNNEIFLYDVDLRTLFQITKTKDVTDPADATKILIHINNSSPAISGDGKRIVFSSNAALTSAKNDDGNQEIYLAVLPNDLTGLSSSTLMPTFIRLTDTGSNDGTEVVKEIFTNYTPTINFDGTLVGFVSTRRTFNALENGTATFNAASEGPNNDQTPDGNAEIFLYNLTTKQYRQVTRSRDVDATVNFQVRGFNSNPFLSGNGNRLVFVSGFNYPGPNAGNNTDFNGEIFIYNVGDAINTFTQVTNTTTDSAPPVPSGGAVNLLSPFTRHLSKDGSLLVFESSGNLSNTNSDKSREIFLYNVTTKAFTQVTNQTVPTNPTATDLAKVDFNFFPSINPAGTFITFSSVLNLVPTSPSDVKTDNGDNSKEVFRYDIVNSTSGSPKFRQLTFASPSLLVFDQRTNIIASFIDTTGTLVAFTLGEDLIGTNAGLAPQLFQARIRPITSTNSQAVVLANAASFNNTAVARGSIVAAFGTMLANNQGTTPSANLPYEINGVTVSVGFAYARLLFVSSGQINFVFPDGIAPADSVSFTVNNNGVLSTGTVKVAEAAPGVFTVVGNGSGPARVECNRISDTGRTSDITPPPCAIGNSAAFNVLTIYGTGWRHANSVSVNINNGSIFPPIFAGAQPDFMGLDQINIFLSEDVANKTDVSLIVSTIVGGTTTTSQSNVTVSFLSSDPLITISNAASFDGTMVARGSVASIFGQNLANATVIAPSGNLPTTLGGVSVLAGGVQAKLLFVSANQINFIVPQGLTPAEKVSVKVNNNGTISTGRIKVTDVAPGVFTSTGNGTGAATATCVLNGVSSAPPCTVGPDNQPTTLVLTGTGWRNAPNTDLTNDSGGVINVAESITVMIGDKTLTPTFAGPQAGLEGFDEIRVVLPASLAGQGTLNVTVKVNLSSTVSVSSNTVTVAVR